MSCLDINAKFCVKEKEQLLERKKFIAQTIISTPSNLSSNLVSALAGLKMDDFPHLCVVGSRRDGRLTTHEQLRVD